MKAIIKFNVCLEIDVDDKMRDKIVSEEEQVKQLKSLLMEECDCKHVEISEYHMELKGFIKCVSGCINTHQCAIIITALGSLRTDRESSTSAET